MKIKINKFLCFLYVLLLSPLCAIEYYCDLGLDKNEWYLSREYEGDGFFYQEFTRFGDLSEAVGCYYWPINSSITEQSGNFLKSFYDLYIQNIPEVFIDNRVIFEDENSLLSELSINEKSNTCHGWSRIFKGKDTVCLVQYMTEKLDEVDKIRGIWEKRLLDAQLQKKEEVSTSPLVVSNLESRLFQDLNQQISLVIPNGWGLKTELFEEIDFREYLFVEPTKNLAILICTADKNKTEFNADLDLIVNEYREKMPSMKFIKNETFTIDSRTGMQKDINGAWFFVNDLNAPINANFLFLPSIGSYLISAIVPADCSENDLEEVKSIISSLNFLN